MGERDGAQTLGQAAQTLSTTSASSVIISLQERGLQEGWAVRRDAVQVQGGEAFARGAGGEVHMARFRGLRCVVKTINSKAADNATLKDLVQEIRIMSSLRHPNLVLFLGASLDQLPPILLMELCEGGSLHDRLIRMAATRQPPSGHWLREASSLSLGFASGMAYLHTAEPPIVHRDLKPQNLLLSRGTLKIGDFGLSKRLTRSAHKRRMTAETGSYRFMAPECFTHESDYGTKVDVYSFALVVFWMFSGVMPFPHLHESIAAARSAALDGERPPLSDRTVRNERLRALLCACWNANPKDRPSFPEIVKELEAIVNEPGWDRSFGCSCFQLWR